MFGFFFFFLVCLLSVISLIKPIHVLANDKISFFLMAEFYSIVFVCMFVYMHIYSIVCLYMYIYVCVVCVCMCVCVCSLSIYPLMDILAISISGLL